MAFSDIRLQNFRSYIDDSFEFSPGVNIIVGPNASGKTNLLEAIMVLALSKSYRAKDTELIRFKKPWARLDGHGDGGARTIKLIDEDMRIKKELIVDEQLIKKLTIAKQVPVVLFEPNHLQLLSGSPELRREYMDDLLEQFTPGYDTLRKQYKRALQQRNFLLKNGNVTHDQLFVWNLRLSDLGGQMALHRQRLIGRINKDISAIYKSMGGGKTKVSVDYVSSCSGEQYSTKLLHKLESGQQLDERRGFTGHGPHRDDFRVNLNGHDADHSASRGEIRTLLLALKTIELQLLEEDRGAKPLLLMDDVFSELDGSRRKALTEAIKGYQTFLTTTDADVVIQHFTETCHIIPTSQNH
ncbi:DNA replication/repair protein RecF [Candidatus Saccharibacteria bacterium]|nr:DNA replication/repair protein RecF [Candidatus Saccharibacteria bacterium]